MFFALLMACATDDVAEDPGVGPPVQGPIPTDDLAEWIATERYLDWTAEEAIHPSDGPHFGDVLTYFSPLLVQSLDSGARQHPEGAAAVKELYGRNGTDVLGHAVMVRVNGSGNDRAWYWYEEFQGDVFADGRGDPLCADCHAAGVDFVLSTP